MTTNKTFFTSKGDKDLYSRLTKTSSTAVDTKTIDYMDAKVEQFIKEKSRYFANRFKLTGDEALTSKGSRMFFKNLFTNGMVGVRKDQFDRTEIHVVRSVLATDSDNNIILCTTQLAKDIKLKGLKDAKVFNMTNKEMAFCVWDEIYDKPTDTSMADFIYMKELYGIMRNNTRAGAIMLTTNRQELIDAYLCYSFITKTNGTANTYGNNGKVYSETLLNHSVDEIKHADINLDVLRNTIIWLEAKINKRLGERDHSNEKDQAGSGERNVQTQFADAEVASTIIEDYTIASVEQFINDYNELFDANLSYKDTVVELQKEIEDQAKTVAGHNGDNQDNLENEMKDKKPKQDKEVKE